MPLGRRSRGTVTSNGSRHRAHPHGAAAEKWLSNAPGPQANTRRRGSIERRIAPVAHGVDARMDPVQASDL
jgi:hypothetical protein